MITFLIDMQIKFIPIEFCFSKRKLDIHNNRFLDNHITTTITQTSCVFGDRTRTPESSSKSISKLLEIDSRNMEEIKFDFRIDCVEVHRFQNVEEFKIDCVEVHDSRNVVEVKIDSRK